MTNIVKQVVGIDVAQNELVVSLGRMNHDTGTDIFAFKTFPNNAVGFKDLWAWVSKLSAKEISVRYVMEATGVYHEKLAYYLSDQGQEVSIVLPNKISNYFRTLDVKTVTDKTASEAITQFGLERKLDSWKRPKPVFKKLRQLTRERDQLVQARTVAKNQLHAEQAEAEPNKNSVARLKKQITFLNKQEQEIKAEIVELTKEEDQVNRSIKMMSSLSGV